MELHYYLFASYLFVLVLVLIFVCKYLFADVKRQRRMLDEKEKQLLSTFRTLEDAMDDYYALAEEAKGELEERSRELENRLLMQMLTVQGASATQQPEVQPQGQGDVVVERLVEIPKKPAAKKSVKATALKTEPRDENQIGFEQLFSDAISNISAKSQLREKIVEMSRGGLSRAEIAKALKITQNEVELVTGMNREPSLPIPINILEKVQ